MQPNSKARDAGHDPDGDGRRFLFAGGMPATKGCGMLLKYFLMLLSMLFLFPAGGSDGDDGGDGDDDSGDDDGAGGEGGGDDDDSSDDDDDGDDDDGAEKLRKTLQKERGLRKAAERRLRQLRRESRQDKGGGGKGGGGTNGDGDEKDDGGEWKNRFEALDRRYRTVSVRNRVSAEAAKRNAIDPAAVARLVELDDVAFDEKGETITNLGDLMDELVEDFPKLFRKSPGKGNGGDEPGRPRKVKPGLDRLTNAYSTESKTKSA